MPKAKKAKKAKKTIIPALRRKGSNGKTKSFKSVMKNELDYFHSWVLKPEYLRVKNLDYDLFKKEGFQIVSFKSGTISNWVGLDPHTMQPIISGEGTGKQNKTKYGRVHVDYFDGLTDVEGNPIRIKQRAFIQRQFTVENPIEYMVKSKKDLNQYQNGFKKLDANMVCLKLVLLHIESKRRCIFEMVKSETTAGVQYEFLLTAIETHPDEFISVANEQVYNGVDPLFNDIGYYENGDQKVIIDNRCEKKVGLMPQGKYCGCAYKS